MRISMMTKKKLEKISIVMCIAFLLSACAGGRIPSYTIDMKRVDLPEKSAGKQIIEKTINVDIIAKNTLLLKRNDKTIKEIKYDFNKDDQVQIDKLKGEGVFIIYEMLDYGDVVSKIIKQKFEEKFRNVVVSVKERPTDRSHTLIEPELAASLESMGWTASHRATLASGKSISEQGTVELWQLHPAHMIWTTPLIILTIPIGPLIYISVVPNIEKDRFVSNIVDAHSKAAEKVVDKIAQRYALSENIPTQWTVSFEVTPLDKPDDKMINASRQKEDYP